MHSRGFVGCSPVSSTGSYRWIDKVLHRLALGMPALAEFSFDLDQGKVSSQPDPAQGNHVFVSGLARAGTTILMRRLYATGQFCSLTYRNMPFVLAPNSFEFLSKGDGSPQEETVRAHGDALRVSVDSPESLDEVFWRIFDGETYIKSSHLSAHNPGGELTSKFADYVKAILHADPQQRPRYLSKNNNNILRLPALAKQFPNSTILVPFRNPNAHAASLLNQHKNFSKQQTDDRFVENYMTWLAHHEFGLNHRPFRFSDNAPDKETADPQMLAYWVQRWVDAYSWLVDTLPDNALLVCYEDLCNDPAVWDHIAQRCGVNPKIDGEDLLRGDVTLEGPPESLELYKTMQTMARKQYT